ncbi:hypothetical protein N431DRAFT_110558 [Stipitochalara longipes BDJ]|nr:hypothetical protein N431DRAFT_110558 [Stipitochalara longipes BDJ]
MIVRTWSQCLRDWKSSCESRPRLWSRTSSCARRDPWLSWLTYRGMLSLSRICVTRALVKLGGRVVWSCADWRASTQSLCMMTVYGVLEGVSRVWCRLEGVGRSVKECEKMGRKQLRTHLSPPGLKVKLDVPACPIGAFLTPSLQMVLQPTRTQFLARSKAQLRGRLWFPNPQGRTPIRRATDRWGG